MASTCSSAIDDGSRGGVDNEMASNSTARAAGVAGSRDGFVTMSAAAREEHTTQKTVRGKWSSPTEFMLTCIGFSVGLGNVWRFPYLCYKNGGGAFLIAYMIMITIIGMPLLFMEFSFGQYFGVGSLTIFKKVCPIFKGIGVGFMIMNSLVSIYYNVIIAMSLYYIIESLSSSLPWASCNNPWNTAECGDAFNQTNRLINASAQLLNASFSADMDGVRSPAVNYSLFSSLLQPHANRASGDCNLRQNLDGFQQLQHVHQRSSPADEYFRLALMGEDPTISIENVGNIRWMLCVCLVLAWLLVLIFVSRGIKSTGKVAYFTATFPYIMLTVLVLRGATLTGSWDGIRYFITPSWEKLASPEVWFYAATQLFYSTNLAWGGMITMASYNKFSHNCYRDAIVVNVVCFLTSVYAGIAVFCIIGYMAHESDVPVHRVITSGPGLAFVVYPRALSLMPLAPLWTSLFFAMLFFLGAGSQMVLIETVVSGFVDEFPRLGLNVCVRFMTTVTICVVFFISGVVMTTQGGMYVLQLLDHYSAGFGVLVIAMLECVAINWVYGVSRMSSNIKEMLGFYPNRWWKICWVCISPLLILGVLVFSLIKYRPVEYSGKLYPIWADVVGWIISLSSIMPIVVMAVYVVCSTPANSILERLKKATEPIVSPFKHSLPTAINNIDIEIYLDPADGDDFSKHSSQLRSNGHHDVHINDCDVTRDSISEEESVSLTTSSSLAKQWTHCDGGSSTGLSQETDGSLRSRSQQQQLQQQRHIKVIVETSDVD